MPRHRAGPIAQRDPRALLASAPGKAVLSAGARRVGGTVRGESSRPQQGSPRAHEKGRSSHERISLAPLDGPWRPVRRLAVWRGTRPSPGQGLGRDAPARPGVRPAVRLRPRRRGRAACDNLLRPTKPCPKGATGPSHGSPGRARHSAGGLPAPCLGTIAGKAPRPARSPALGFRVGGHSSGRDAARA